MTVSTACESKVTDTPLPKLVKAREGGGKGSAKTGLWVSGKEGDGKRDRDRERERQRQRQRETRSHVVIEDLCPGRKQATRAVRVAMGAGWSLPPTRNTYR